MIFYTALFGQCLGKQGNSLLQFQTAVVLGIFLIMQKMPIGCLKPPKQCLRCCRSSSSSSSAEGVVWSRSTLKQWCFFNIWPEVIKLFFMLNSTCQLSTKFQLLIKTEIPTNEKVSFFKSFRCSIYPADKCKMPTIVGILTFMSRINFVLSWVEHEKSFITWAWTFLIIHEHFCCV